MFEIFFMFTIIFVAYVIYHMFNELKEAPTQKSAALKTKQDAPAVFTTKPVSVPAAATTTAAPKATTQTKKPAAIKPATIKKTTVTAAAKTIENKKGLRDPKTGEVATSYNNYRFTKRWIKDALVSEGLLPKVYKNDELEPTIEANIKAAIIKLEALKTYKA